MYRTAERVRCVGVTGFGRAGAAIAECLAESGFDVLVLEPDARAVQLAWQAIHATQQLLVEHGELTTPAADAAVGRIRLVESLDGLGESDFLIETVTEDLELKRRVIGEIEGVVAPDVVIASNTSGYPITKLQEGMADPGRICGMHWTLMASMSRFLEVTRGEQTAPEASAICARMGERSGKEPAILNKDKPGFLANRLLYAMYREAFALVAEGVADIESIDRVVRNDTGLVLASMGLFRLMDVAGLPAVRAVASHLFADLATDTAPPEMLNDLVDAGRDGLRTGKGFYDYTPEQAEAAMAEVRALMLAAKKTIDRLREEKGPG